MTDTPPPPPPPLPLPPQPRRADDKNIRGELDRLMHMRRIRGGDNGAEKMSLQAQRCMTHLKGHSWRTSATMIGSASVIIAAGVFAWGTNEHHEMRTTAALVTHAHADNALSRELETLRMRLLTQLAVIDGKLDRLSERVRRNTQPPPGERTHP